MSDALIFEVIKNEKQRTYLFAEGSIVVKNVVKLAVHPDGSHRIETVEGKKLVIRYGWLGIEIIADVWGG